MQETFFQNTHQLLHHLHQRGLSITNYKKAKCYLLTNNLHSIINGYSHYFYESNQEQYKVGTTFDEVATAYLFDKEIKTSLLKAILEIERHLSSLFAYTFSEKYPKNPEFYLRAESYQPPKDMKSKLNDSLRRLSSLLNRHRKQKNSKLRQYMEDHECVPFSVVVNYLTFGEIVTLLRLAPISIQNKLAKRLYTFISHHHRITKAFTPAILISFVENIAEVRNVCAHDNQLWDFKCRKHLKYYPDIHDHFCIEHHIPKNDIYNVYIVLSCFMTPIKYEILTNTLKNRFRSFEKKLHSQSINIFLQSLGFPPDWHQ